MANNFVFGQSTIRFQCHSNTTLSELTKEIIFLETQMFRIENRNNFVFTYDAHLLGHFPNRGMDAKDSQSRPYESLSTPTNSFPVQYY